MNAKLIKPDGTEIEVAPENETDFSLEELYKLLECKTIEVVYNIKLPGMIMIVDEEGKLGDNPKINIEATKLLKFADHIVGNAIVCPVTMLE